MVETSVHLGFEVGTGNSITVPIRHIAITGMTQLSGKTTTLEGLVSRSGMSAVAFITKRAEGSFNGDYHAVPPYFVHRADWLFVSSILEATLREKMRFERSWIMRACKGQTSLDGVQRNVKLLMAKAKGLSADVYMTLDHYLDIVVPQIGRLDYTDSISLHPGLNVMNLSAYTTELQALVIRSVLEWVYTNGRNTLVIIPEAWEFIPQNRGSPVLLACEQLIRKGGAARNFVWLDSQDIAGVHKNILRSVGVWILGVQREANEVKRTLEHIPAARQSLHPNNIMELERGQFLVSYDRTIVKTYVQPAWMNESMARSVAVGDLPVPPTVPKPTKVVMERAVDEAEARALREENASLRQRISTLEALLSRRNDPVAAPNEPAKPAGQPAALVTPIAHAAPRNSPEDLDFIYAEIKHRAMTDGDPVLLKLLRAAPEIEVAVTREVIKADTKTQPGFLAMMISEGFFERATSFQAVVAELKRRGRTVHHTNVKRDLNRLAEQGFLTCEGEDAYQAVPRMRVNIIEG